jgi:hypothetical protein
MALTELAGQMEHQELMVPTEHQVQTVQAELMELMELMVLQGLTERQERMEQLEYQEMTLLTQVDGYMMEQVLHLPQHSLRQIVQQYLL